MFGFLAPIAKAVGGMFAGGNAAATLGGIGSVLGGVAGLKQANQTHPTVRENLLDQARGAREAAAEYGFNPLTMLQYGQTGAGYAGAPIGGGGAPLASIQMITDGLKDISDITTGDAARRRAKQDLDIDLARIRLDQARSGVILGPNVATDFPGSPSPLGHRAPSVVQAGSAPIEAAPPRFGFGKNAKHYYQTVVGNHPTADSAGVIDIADSHLDRGVGLYFDGYYMQAPPGWSDGQQAEDELGEGASSAWYSIPHNYAFVKHNLAGYLKYRSDRSAAQTAQAERQVGVSSGGLHPVTRGRAKVLEAKGVTITEIGGKYYVRAEDRAR